MQLQNDKLYDIVLPTVIVQLHKRARGHLDIGPAGSTVILTTHMR